MEAASKVRSSIAEREMGTAADAASLKAHNLNVGLLFADLKLYAGSEIEIPIYDELKVAPTEESKP